MFTRAVLMSQNPNCFCCSSVGGSISSKLFGCGVNVLWILCVLLTNCLQTIWLRHSMLIDPLCKLSRCFRKKVEEMFLSPIAPLISWSVSSIVLVSFKPCKTNIKQFFLAIWIVVSFSPILMMGTIISFWKVALNFIILSACVGIDATNYVHVSVVFFCTLVISSSWLVLRFSATIFLKSSWSMTFPEVRYCFWL